MFGFKLIPLVALATSVFGTPLITETAWPIVPGTVSTSVSGAALPTNNTTVTPTATETGLLPTINVTSIPIVTETGLPTTVSTDTGLPTIPTGEPILNSTSLKVRQNGQVYTGDATFYTPGLGACGETDGPNDFIAAASFILFDNFPGATGNPNTNPICGKSLTAHANGNSVTVKITDRCAGCQGQGDLDFSPAAFQQLAPLSVGRIPGMTWSFN